MTTFTLHLGEQNALYSHPKTGKPYTKPLYHYAVRVRGVGVLEGFSWSREGGVARGLLARKIAEPSDEMRVMRGGADTFKPSKVGNWAGLTVDESSAKSVRLAPWRTFSAKEVLN